METTSTETQLFDPTLLFADGKETLAESPIIAVLDPHELSFEFGLWLAGLASFIRSGGQAFDKGASEATQRDWAKECRLTYAALVKCTKLSFRLRQALIAQGGEFETNGRRISVSDLDAFTLVVRDVIVLNESVLRGGKLDFADWRSWAENLTGRLSVSPVRNKLIDISNSSGGSFLPAKLRELLAAGRMPFSDDVDLRTLLPRFGSLLGSLGVVARMLERDEPLKPSLIVFARIYEQTNELINHMNNRLSRFSSEGAVMFDSLDSASYTAGLELKKVYSQELTGLVGVRPVPSVFARVETACELLTDSFRQILAGFASVIDERISLSDLFPSYTVKLEQSLALRQHLWDLLDAVRAAEQDPDKKSLEIATGQLGEFLQRTASFLFHKDKETFERFAEEVFATTEKKDIVPILHRFGAYLETLHGQVNMRTVLADHPFHR